MKAVVLEKLGSHNVLKVSNVPKPSNPKPNEIIIKMKYAGVNFADTLMRRGLYRWVPSKKGFILGMEGSGVIEDIGSEITSFSLNDQVIVGCQSGTYTEYLKIHKKYVYPAVENFTPEENSAFAVSFLTAYFGLVVIGKACIGEKILINAAAGALGTSAVQLAKSMGLNVIGTAGNSKKIEFIKNKLEVPAIKYSDLKEKIMELTDKKGINIILESIGGKVFRDSLSCLAPLGRIIVVGVSSIKFNKLNPLTWWSAWRSIPRINILKMLGNSQGIHAFHLGRLLDNNFEKVGEIIPKLRRLIVENNIRPVIDNIYPLADVGIAHRRLESRQSIGKILLKIS